MGSAATQRQGSSRDGGSVRRARASPRLAVVLGAVLLGLTAADLALGRVAHGRGLSHPGGGVAVLLLPFAVVGVIVAYRRPANPIGWIMIVLALSSILGADATVYSVLRYRGGEHGLPLGRLAVALSPLWLPLFLLLPLPVALFPDGRIPAGRWRWTFWAYIAVAVVFAGSYLVPDSRAFTASRIVVGSDGELSSMHAPKGEAWVLDAAYGVAVLLLVLYQVLRFRRATGVERQQLKWFLSGGAVSILCLLVASATSLGFLIGGLVALPVSIGIGVLKYRLFEIDRLISRTITYALLTATVVGVFAGLVLVTTRVLPLSSPVGVAASTLAAAALFNPLRRRLQRLVDRRFNRTSYTADAILGAFAGRLRDEVELDAIQHHLIEAAAVALAPAHASLWIRPEAGPTEAT